MRIDQPDELELSYTRAMMAFLLFAQAPKHALLIGLGGGSLVKFIYRKLPQTRMRVIEVDAGVVAVARAYFALPQDGERLSVVVDEGADYIQRAREPVDALLIDAYDGRSLAQSLAADAFYESARSLLTAAGVLVMNLWSSDRAFDRNLARIERAFLNQCLCLPAERPGNVIVFAFASVRERLRWVDLQEHASGLQQSFGLEFPRFVRDLRQMNRYDANGVQIGG